MRQKAPRQSSSCFTSSCLSCLASDYNSYLQQLPFLTLLHRLKYYGVPLLSGGHPQNSSPFIRAGFAEENSHNCGSQSVIGGFVGVIAVSGTMGSQSRDETQPMSDTATASLAGNPNGLSTMMPDLSSAGLPLKPSSMFQDLAYSPDNITFPKNLPSFYLQGALVERTLPQEFSPMAPHLQLKSQSAWPSPPLGPGDIDLDYCLKDGSLNGTGYGCSTSSPAQWASPLPTLYSDATQRPSQTSHPHLLNDICTPPPSTDLTMDQGDMIGPYSDGIPSTIKYTDMGACNALLGMEYPILDRTLGASRHSRRSSPTDMLASSSTPKNDLLALHSVNASPASSGGLVDEDKCDGEEPYARLIYRALMSRPNHAMTLQEMYQWFRENTSRAADEKGGWQNSIRHNLSMNAVSLPLQLLTCHFLFCL